MSRQEHSDLQDGIGSYKLKNGERRYRVVMKVNGRTVSKGGFISKGAARAWRDGQRADVMRGDWIDPKRSAITVAALTEDFMASKRKLRPRSRELYTYLIDSHINPAFGGWQLARITTDAVDRWMESLAANERIGPSTEAKALRLLSQIMQFAVQRRRIAYNPCLGVESPDVPTTEMPFLTEAQVADLAERIGSAHGWRAMVLLAAYGGLRWGECVGLPISKVDPLRSRVRVEQQLQRDATIAEPKSTMSRRTVRLPRWLSEEVAAAIALRNPAPDLPEDHRDLLFLTADGTALVHSSNWNRNVWRPAVRDALPEHLHGLRFHDLRHTAVAIALESARRAGQPLNPKALQERMGHSTIRMTLDRYGHLMDGHDDEMVEAMTNPFAARSALGQ